MRAVDFHFAVEPIAEDEVVGELEAVRLLGGEGGGEGGREGGVRGEHRWGQRYTANHPPTRLTSINVLKH